MGWKNRLAFTTLGLATIAAAFGTRYEVIGTLSSTALLVFAGALLLASVAWKTLLNKKIESNDVVSFITAALGVILIVTGLLVPFDVQTWDWFNNLALYASVFAGIFIVIMGFTTKK